MLERFLSKVVMCPMSGCWLWVACTDKQGYGRFARCCVNPAHLEPVSDAENKRRGGFFLYSRIE